MTSPIVDVLMFVVSPYIPKYLSEEIDFEKENDIFFPITLVQQESISILNEIANRVLNNTSFKCESVTFDISRVMDWNFMKEASFMEEEEAIEEYIIQKVAWFDEGGVDSVFGRGFLMIPAVSQEMAGKILKAGEFFPKYEEPKGKGKKKNVYLNPPQWVVQGTKFIVNQSTQECQFVWHIWERTMSIATSDGERYFMLESQWIPVQLLFG